MAFAVIAVAGRTVRMFAEYAVSRSSLARTASKRLSPPYVTTAQNTLNSLADGAVALVLAMTFGYLSFA